MTKSRFLLALLVLVQVGACFAPAQRREDDLLQEARAWNDDLRWARWDVLGQALTPEENARMQERRDLIAKELVIADNEVTAVHFQPGSRGAAVSVTLDWYKKSEAVLRQTTLEQQWELRAGHWIMIKQKRTRGDRFPLVPEPVEKQRAPSPAAGSVPG
ncbi:MAG: hypothetical protein ABSB49_08020 [Polyangia bacterium]|jgi:hypothetical protein